MNIKSPQMMDIPDLRSLWKEAFGDTDEFLDMFFETAFHPDRAMCITVDGEIAGALYWFNCEHQGESVAYIYAVATAKTYRGQGVCHKLMEYTHTYLAGLGYSGAILVPGSKELFDFYKGMGYETCGYIKEFKTTAGAEEIELKVIDKTEYARLRRELLPEDGVIQENENLDFFEKYAMFYKGADFVLAGRREGAFFRGIEFLGDERKISGIIKSLNCMEGTFRTYGEERPFAMYYSLGDSKKEMPRYFGLAFD